MKLLGAIYVYNGQLISTYKGSFEQAEKFRESPKEMAKRFQNAGIEEIHFVDLNASKHQKLINTAHLEKIISLGLKVQYAGGVRTMECIDELFQKGVNQVIIGISGASIIPEALKKYGSEKILLGIKAKYDKLVTEKKGVTNVIDYAEQIANTDIKYVVFKDILSSGVMIHPNYDMVEKIGLLSGKEIYAAGGISELKHLQILKHNNVYAAIIGRAFYERKLSIREAIELLG